MKKITGFCFLFALLLAATIDSRADDWPQWMGPQRDGIWRERGLVERFPADGPKIVWRVPVNAGYCGPAVAANRVYLVDRLQKKPLERAKGERPDGTVPGDERVLCLDAKTGATLWQHSYDCSYKIGYPNGPRATPVVSGGKVYTLGAMGDLLCLEAESGKPLWSRQFLKDFSLSSPPVWGWAAHPLLDQGRLICMVGGSNSAVVAFNKDNGTEVWRALTAKEIGYAPPMIYEIAGQRQLIIWHPDAVCALNPVTGAELWQHKYPVEGKPQRPEVTIVAPRLHRDRLAFSSYYHGLLLLEVTNRPPGARVVWNRQSTSKSKLTDGLHTVMSSLVFNDDFIYGICGMGELRCLDAGTGDRKWESYAVTDGKPGLFANAFIIPQADRYFFWNDQGEFILGQLGGDGFKEISRAKLLPAIEHTRGRDVLWCHPAFANRCAYVHNGRELICVSLAKEQG